MSKYPIVSVGHYSSVVGLPISIQRSAKVNTQLCVAIVLPKHEAEAVAPLIAKVVEDTLGLIAERTKGASE